MSQINNEKPPAYQPEAGGASQAPIQGQTPEQQAPIQGQTPEQRPEPIQVPSQTVPPQETPSTKTEPQTQSPTINSETINPPSAAITHQYRSEPVINAAAPNSSARVTPISELKDTPALIVCPFCHQRGVTNVKKEGEDKQMIMGAVLCLICVCATCLPCIMGCFVETKHSCSRCGSQVKVVDG